MKSIVAVVCGLIAVGGIVQGDKTLASRVTVLKPINTIPVGSTLPFDKSALVGNYYFGDGLGVNCHLELKTGGRFFFRWTGCMGEYDKNEGNWVVKGDTLFLNPEKENKHEGFEGVNVRFVPVVWNQRLYLIDEYEAPGFFSKMPDDRSGELRRGMSGNHFVKRGASFESSSVPLKNHIPKRFEEFVNKPATACLIIAVNSDGTVLLDKGSKNRLRPGLMLGADEWYTGDLEIISVTPDASIAKPGYFFNSEHLVEVGDRFDTGGGWSGPHGTGWPRLAKPTVIKPRDKKTISIDGES